MFLLSNFHRKSKLYKMIIIVRIIPKTMKRSPILVYELNRVVKNLTDQKLENFSLLLLKITFTFETTSSIAFNHLNCLTKVV